MNLEAFLQLPIAMSGGANTSPVVSEIYCIGKDTFKTNRDISSLQTESYILLEQKLEEGVKETISSLEELNERLKDKSVYCISLTAVQWIIREFQSLDKDAKLPKLEESCLKFLFIEGEAGKNTAVSNNQSGFIAFIHGIHTFALLADPVDKKCPAFSDELLKKYTWIANRLNEFTGKSDSDTLSYFSETLTKESVTKAWAKTVDESHTFDDLIKFLMTPETLIEYLKKTKPEEKKEEENMGTAVGSIINSLSEEMSKKEEPLSSTVGSTVDETAEELEKKPKTGGFSKKSYAKTAEQYLMELD